jgi:hypothetical protein
MKNLRLLLTTVVACNFLACSQTSGDDVTEQFLAQYSGRYEETTDRTGEQLVIARDGSIEVLQHRNVGEQNNPRIPRQTNCSFWLRGEVTFVDQLSMETRTRTNSDGEIYYIPQTHNLVFTVYEVELTDDLEPGSTTSSGCLAFQEKMTGVLSVYTFGMELFGGGTLRLHTQGEDTYQGGERTDLTLDEVFVRQ